MVSPLRFIDVAQVRRTVTARHAAQRDCGYDVTSPVVVCAVTVYQAPGGSRTSARTVCPSTS